MRRSYSMLLVLAGAGFMLLGGGYATGYLTLPSDGGSSCRAVCGLGLLLNFLLGQQVGGFLAGSLLTVIGVGLLLAGRRRFR